MSEEEAPVRISSVAMRATAVGVISTIPIVGPVLGELVDAFIPDVRFRRVERLADELKEKVTELSDRLDSEYVRREEFAVLFEDALERATQARNDQKTGAFAAFMAHSMTTDRPSLADRQRYLDILDQLRPVHLQILAALAAGSGPEPSSPPSFTVGQAAAAALTRALSYVEGAEWEDLADLERRGLTCPLAEASLQIATNVRNALLPLGLAFVEFVAAEAPAASRVATPATRTAPTSLTRPSIRLDLRYYGDSQKLELANNGTEAIFGVAIEFPSDAAPLDFQGGFDSSMPFSEIPAGQSVHVSAIRLLPAGPVRTAFNVHIRGRTADNQQVDQDAFLDLAG